MNVCDISHIQILFFIFNKSEIENIREQAESYSSTSQSFISNLLF